MKGDKAGKLFVTVFGPSDEHMKVLCVLAIVCSKQRSRVQVPFFKDAFFSFSVLGTYHDRCIYGAAGILLCSERGKNYKDGLAQHRCSPVLKPGKKYPVLGHMRWSGDHPTRDTFFFLLMIQ